MTEKTKRIHLSYDDDLRRDVEAARDRLKEEQGIDMTLAGTASWLVRKGLEAIADNVAA